MKILALEFSSDQRSVAIVAGGLLLGWARESDPRATHAFGMIEAILKHTGLEREEIECLAVGVGPGSYTGIRTAIALAQGWQLARPVRLLGISSMECLAAGAHGKGWFGSVNIVIDAQRGEYYLGTYEIDEAGVREAAPLKLATREEVASRAAANEIVAGPDAERLFVNGRNLFPCAEILGELAESRANFVVGEALEPVYLRETTFVKAPPTRFPPAIA